MNQDVPRRQPTTVWRQGNVIKFYDLKCRERSGDFISVMYKAKLEGHKSFVLDLPKTEAAFPNACVPLAALIRHYRDTGIDIVVKHASEFRGIAQIDSPVRALPDEVNRMGNRFLSTIWEFHDEYMINSLVNAFVEIISRQVECSLGVLQSLEWCLNEVMDNVLQHSSGVCGFMAAQLHPKGKTVAICIADTGIGIYKSLVGGDYHPESAVQAIRLATQEGVTRDPKVGAGNGLWGLTQIVKKNHGIMAITSGAGYLFVEEDLETSREQLPYPDKEHQCTFIDFQLDTNKVIDIGEALGGFQPVNLRLESFEETDGMHVVNVLRYARGTGTRRSGGHMRNLICNMLNEGARHVVLDFAGIRTVSSSFADELLGRMVSAIGTHKFRESVGLSGMNEFVRFIVDKTLAQRIIGNDQ